MPQTLLSSPQLHMQLLSTVVNASWEDIPIASRLQKALPLPPNNIAARELVVISMTKEMLTGTAHHHLLTESTLNSYAHTTLLNAEPPTLLTSQPLTQLEDSMLPILELDKHVSTEYQLLAVPQPSSQLPPQVLRLNTLNSTTTKTTKQPPQLVQV